jgi:hypothetical protein
VPIFSLYGNAGFGSAVPGIDDVNGDGYADFVIGGSPNANIDFNSDLPEKLAFGEHRTTSERFRRRDSNPNKRIQSPLSCHWTTPEESSETLQNHRQNARLPARSRRGGRSSHLPARRNS